MLYRKSLYLLALNLAATQNLDEVSQADIHRQYGDSLYTKGDYDGAMQQYVKTIGHLQPSYVIRKVSWNSTTPHVKPKWLSCSIFSTSMHNGFTISLRTSKNCIL
jgi:hypothetical protein